MTTEDTRPQRQVVSTPGNPDEKPLPAPLRSVFGPPLNDVEKKRRSKIILFNGFYF